MRAADAVRLEIGATEQELHEHEERGVELRQRLGRALAEARDHPELTLEEGRKVPEKEIPRQTANRLIRESKADAQKAGAEREWAAHKLNKLDR